MQNSTLPATQHIALLCNPLLSRQGLQLADKVALIVKQKGLKYSLFTTYWPVVWNDFTNVWIVGGDGTLNYFINQYPQMHLPITPLGGGSGNDFRWMLYGDCGVEEQIEKVLKGATQQIDAGCCNGRLFLNGIGIGFDGTIVKKLMGKQKAPGKLSYYAAILKQILFYREFPFRFGGVKGDLYQKAFMLTIANGRRFGGGFTVAPLARPDDGLLDLVIINAISPLHRLRYLPVMEKGKHLSLSFVYHQQQTEIQITTAGTVSAHCDGEYFESDSFRITVLPNAFTFGI